MNNNEKSENVRIKARKAYREACEGINVKENEKIVLECKISFWCYYFALNIPEANIKAHEQVLLEIKDPEYSCLFAEYIEEANIEEHFKVIINSGDKYWLNWFIKHVDYKNTKVEEWLLYI